jgi:alkylhydroperoxidase family enzyme
VRFAVARQEGLDEGQVALIDDDHAASELPERQKAALAFADAFLAAGGPPSAEVRDQVLAALRSDEVAELGLGLALFHGFSKLLIALGCEPEQMDTTVLRTPGSA